MWKLPAAATSCDLAPAPYQPGQTLCLRRAKDELVPGRGFGIGINSGLPATSGRVYGRAVVRILCWAACRRRTTVETRKQQYEPPPSTSASRISQGSGEISSRARNVSRGAPQYSARIRWRGHITPLTARAPETTTCEDPPRSNAARIVSGPCSDGASWHPGLRRPSTCNGKNDRCMRLQPFN